MMPEHCSEVNRYEVDFPLTTGKITKAFEGKRTYHRTQYLVLSNKDEMAVVRLKKKFSDGLFWPIKEIQIISLPENTEFVEDDEIDVLNRFIMTRVAKQHRPKVVVVKGRFEHISFVRYDGAVTLNVVDVGPPFPPKLHSLVEEALIFGVIESAVEIDAVVVDYNDILKDVRTGAVMFPCHASCLRFTGKTCFLDRMPELGPEDREDITLIGCDLSLRIFRELYHFTPSFIDMCPKRVLKERDVRGPTVIRCCNISNCEMSGEIAMVPWGASLMDVEEALEYLLVPLK